VAADNVLETSINNVNPISHPAGVIMNAGWIEHTAGKFSFYLDGQTPSVSRVAKKLDEERMAVADALGIKKVSNEEMSSRMYARFADRKGNVHQERYYKGVYDAPSDLKHRYLVEDVMYGLVPMAEIAKIAKIRTPTFDSVITLAGIANQVNYWREGMTVDKLGLHSMSPERMVEFVSIGS
jgi:opine dehydrogenase